MSLAIYENALPDSLFSQGNNNNPFTIAFDGTTGGTIEKRLYLRNSSTLYYYTNIKVQPIANGDNVVNTGDFYWKLKAGDAQPLLAEWNTITAGDEIDLSDLGNASNADISSYLPFWVKISVPVNTSIQVFDNVTLRITATQNLI